MSLLSSHNSNFVSGREGIREHKGSDLLVTPSSSTIVGGVFLKWGRNME
jgi:hypothetical protein